MPAAAVDKMLMGEGTDSIKGMGGMRSVDFGRTTTRPGGPLPAETAAPPDFLLDDGDGRTRFVVFEEPRGSVFLDRLSGSSCSARVRVVESRTESNDNIWVDRTLRSIGWSSASLDLDSEVRARVRSRNCLIGELNQDPEDDDDAVGQGLAGPGSADLPGDATVSEDSRRVVRGF